MSHEDTRRGERLKLTDLADLPNVLQTIGQHVANGPMLGQGVPLLASLKIRFEASDFGDFDVVVDCLYRKEVTDADALKVLAVNKHEIEKFGPARKVRNR